MQVSRNQIRLLKIELKAIRRASRDIFITSGESRILADRIGEIRLEIRRIRKEIRLQNRTGYVNLNNRMNAMRASYRAGGLNLGQYDDDRRD